MCRENLSFLPFYHFIIIITEFIGEEEEEEEREIYDMIILII